MFSSNQPTQKRIVPSPTRGYSPTDNFRRDLLKYDSFIMTQFIITHFSNPPMLDLPERPEYSHWGDSLKKDHRVSKVGCVFLTNEFLIILFCSFYWIILIFLHLDKRDYVMGLMKGHQVRHPPFPRPDLVQYQMGYVRHWTTIGIVSYKNKQYIYNIKMKLFWSHLSPSPLSSLTRPSMMGLDHPLSSTGSGQIPGLSIPNSRTNYLQTLSKTSNQDRNDDFVIQDQDFPALGKCKTDNIFSKMTFLDNPTKSNIGQSSLDDPSDR